MPDQEHPSIEGLKAAVSRKILPVKAGDASPVAIRAQEALRKAYPSDMVGVQVREMPMTDRHAFSNILGETSLGPVNLPEIGTINPRGDREQIDLNPGVSAAFSQRDVEGTLAHELEHVRQGRVRAPLTRLKEFSMPYAQRPDEIAAHTAGDTYESLTRHHTPPDEDMVIHALNELLLPRINATKQ